ncbi:MAG TPA: kynureninase [Candidatus Sulfotelmatobacter sp.]|nr:kynureninase [Candidatus Sulfotelmatobacter sp.]
MNSTTYQTGEDFALAMDARDPLAHFRERFYLPKTKSGEDCIYLCGHSLGLQPKSVRSYLDEELGKWADQGVEAHFHGRNPWVPYHRLLTEQTAELVGASPAEVVVMSSLTVNLHLMMVSFYRPTAKRNKILIERGAFPSDQYAVKSQIRFHGFDPGTSLLELTPREGESCMRDEDIESLIEREGDSIALILLGGLNYSTGQVFDMAGITRAGRQMGCVVGFDLAHVAGNIPLRLHDWGPDFAVWCGYKYLNGGPGCVGGCFVHERHARAWDLPRFAGWWGHDETLRFLMGPDFHPMEGADGWQLSNQAILAVAPLRASMDLFAEATMQRLRAKSISLTGYLDFLLTQQISPKFSIITPSEAERRGAQLSIRLGRDGHKLCDQLAAKGVIGDWREPDIFRVAAVPLYTSYQDVYRFVQHFSAAL